MNAMWLPLLGMIRSPRSLTLRVPLCGICLAPPSALGQALSALLFLYREVLKIDLPWLQDVDRVQRPPKLPVVFTRDEAQRVIASATPTTPLTLQLMYGCGLRVLEVGRLRVKDDRV